MTDAEDATPQQPFYKAVPQADNSSAVFAQATGLFMVVCHEGWRESIVCADMYPWAADWLVEQIQGRPFAPETRP